MTAWGASGPFDQVYEKFGLTGPSTFIAATDFTQAIITHTYLAHVRHRYRCLREEGYRVLPEEGRRGHQPVVARHLIS